MSAYDPKRTKVGLKSCSAAACCQTVCRHAGGVGTAPRLDSEQFSSAPPNASATALISGAKAL